MFNWTFPLLQQLTWTPSSARKPAAMTCALLHLEVWANWSKVWLQEHTELSVRWNRHKGMAVLPLCSPYITLKTILTTIKHFPKVAFLQKQPLQLPQRYCTTMFCSLSELRTAHSTISVLGFDQFTDFFMPAHPLGPHYLGRGVREKSDEEI